MKEKIILYVCLALITIYYLVEFILSKKCQDKVIKLIQAKKYQECLDYLNTTEVKIGMPAYNREYIKLNLYLLTKDDEKVVKQFDMLLEAKINAKQRKDLHVKAFLYYLNKENVSKCQQLLGLLEKECSEVDMKEFNRSYDIFVRKSGDHIGEITELYEKEENQDLKRTYAYLLYIQYQNINDIKNANKFKTIVDEAK